ncbi:MAG: VCBS repeat-containing protein [Anaerolineae bacterium]|nr:VCBS repeat-containing protein [Anaerolineae bacterium]
MRSSLGLTLQWSRGGCYSSWCETGWYSSPAVINIDGDPQAEIIASAYSVIALDGASGGLQWRVGGTGNRTWPGIALADINKDGQTEIVVAQSGPWVTAYRLDSTQLWRKQPSGSGGEYRGMLVADLDTANPNMDVVVTRARGTPGSETNTWVLDANGITRTGWPQLSSTNVSNENGYAWGVYNNNAAAADLLPGSAGLELVVPSDVHYINAYTPSGGLLPVNNTVYPGKNYWGKVGVWEDLGVEQRGWGACDGVRAESYRANFADGPAVIADVNGDGTREVIAVGNMYDCDAGYPPSRYYAPYIFNADRTRFNAGGYDWRSIPVNTGAPLSEDYNVIQSASPSPVPADLDGDGKLEILFASYDGRVHAYWLDKTEHGDWPFEVTTAEDGLRFASEPLVADLNCDGKSEVIFTSWPGNTSGRIGDVFIVDYQGKLMFKSALPAGFGKNWNGALAAPTLANVDLDSNLEIVVNTINAGVAVYDIDGSAGACNLQWPTGRGNYQRTAGR